MTFQNLQRQLRLIQDENDVDCLYLGIVDAPTLSMIYLVDGAHEDVGIRKHPYPPRYKPSTLDEKVLRIPAANSP